MQQASSPRLTPEERKRDRRKRSLFLKGCERARPIRKSGRGATRRGPQAGARATHRGHTQHTYVQAHVSGSLRAGTRRQGHGRHRRTYSQGGDSDWAALRALRAVEAPPGSWAKIARTHESGISFGRFMFICHPVSETLSPEYRDRGMAVTAGLLLGRTLGGNAHW